MTDEQVNAIITKLNEATHTLRAVPHLPDMDVAEWNATPIGKAVRRIEEAVEMLLEDD